MVGYKQALEQAAYTVHDTGEPMVSSGHSALATILFHMLSAGHIYAVAVQKIAEAALADGSTKEEVVQLASIGACGLALDHCSRDLKRHIKLECKLAAEMTLPIRCLDPELAVEIEEDVSVLLPQTVCPTFRALW